MLPGGGYHRDFEEHSTRRGLEAWAIECAGADVKLVAKVQAQSCNVWKQNSTDTIECAGNRFSRAPFSDFGAALAQMRTWLVAYYKDDTKTRSSAENAGCHENYSEHSKYCGHYSRLLCMHSWVRAANAGSHVAMCLAPQAPRWEAMFSSHAKQVQRTRISIKLITFITS